MPETAAALGIDIPAEFSDILLTIRLVESGERYGVTPNRANASGAYQYIASSWNNYGGYPHAYLAPPAIQDERALADVQAILEMWKGDVSMVPVMWYFPRAAREPALMDIVPLPGSGNRLTVRQYQHRWLDTLAFVTGTPIHYGDTARLPDLRFISGIPPELPERQPELLEISFPVLGRGLVAPPAHCGDSCVGTDAIVYGQKLQPVLAVVDGVVTGRDIDDPVSGAVTLTLTDRFGYTYHYAGFNDDSPDSTDGEADISYRFTSLAEIGTSIRAGQIIGFLGDTDPMPQKEHVGDDGEPIWPHIRLTITAADGTRLDADALVAAAQDRQACHVAIGPWSVPKSASKLDRGTELVSALLDGGWTLHADGTVTAFGRAALIVPPDDCVWAPVDPFGPGESGNRAPDDWGQEFTIDAEYWVSGSRASDGDPPTAPVRR